ncbi:glycosyltransferase [Lactiplantibacillus paraxiangfangensis]|uniref:glycosyltransferase n=1 Tax=Lactiplantibacillus paraxiangfangensis TaxID=3076224 RepID=UPI0030C74A80
MKILYISKLDWFRTKQRPQQLVEHLSQEDKVDFLSIKPWKKKDVKLDTVNNVKSKLTRGNLTVYRKKVTPKRESLIGEKISDLIMKRYIKELFAKEKYDVIICTLPHHVKYLSKTLRCPVVYDCMDDQVEMSENKEKALKEEMALLRVADQVVVSSEYLKSQLRKKYNYGMPIEVINNGVDVDKFYNYHIKYGNQYKKSNIVGYVGSIDYWMDFNAIEKAATNFPQYKFLFYGPISSIVKSKTKSLPENVQFLGAVNYDDVPKVINSFEVAIMPFEINDLIRAVNPVKLYEYLALGKKTIASEYSETAKFGSLITRYSTSEDFKNKISELMEKKESKAEEKKKILFTFENSWSERAKELRRVCKAVLGKRAI